MTFFDPLFAIAFVILCCVQTFRITSTLRREASLFSEFKLPKNIGLAVMLFPLGSLLIVIVAFRRPLPLGSVGALACFIPALMIAYRLKRALEYAWSDRVNGVRVVIPKITQIALSGITFALISLLWQ